MAGRSFHSSPDQVPAISSVVLISQRSKRNPLSAVTSGRAVPKCLWQGLWPAGESQTPTTAWLEEKPQGSWDKRGVTACLCLYFSLLLLVYILCQCMNITVFTEND